MADQARRGGEAPGDEEKKTFLTEPNLKGEELADDFPDYEDDMTPEEDNQDTAMLKKEHQMRIMDDALELMKREFAARMAEVARKEAKLAREKAALDGMVERFRDFIQENDAKKEKALRKAAEEAEALERLAAEEADWERRIEEASRRRQALADTTQSLIPYCSFLARVVEDPSSEFADTQDMLSRYSTLSTTHAAQEATMRRKQAAAKEVRQRIAELGWRGETRKLDLSSEIEAGRRRLEALAEAGRELADERAGADELDRRLVVEASQVNMSVVNLLSRCRDSVAVTAATVAGEAPPPAGAAGAAAAAAGSAPGGAAAAAAAGGAGASAGSRAKAAAKVLTQMRVAPPADKSKAELQRHIQDMLAVVEQRMTDLVELERAFPAWKAQQQAAAAAEARKAEAQRRMDEETKRIREAALAGAKQRVAGLRQQQRARLEEDSVFTASDVGGGGSVATGYASDGGDDDEGAAQSEGGAAVAKFLSGHTYRVRLGGSAPATEGRDSRESGKPAASGALSSGGAAGKSGFGASASALRL
ncbi:hypothetical protein FNF29_07169 [Cafeteria roenbergensis]|uniref:DUF4200 domain-containing protein n=1 Tax=Cafeteria roenbergensis TaxID=33653 RepID=A0A5A8C4H3_CAFRO|nr:hypothetical protein FNF29_07169 [Cafeteria roenbergensis]|eukprot:KAA0147715.1 hypothetical protein FNF29_07169 [Cafeteria roenbergensis]